MNFWNTSSIYHPLDDVKGVATWYVIISRKLYIYNVRIALSNRPSIYIMQEFWDVHPIS